MNSLNIRRTLTVSLLLTASASAQFAMAQAVPATDTEAPAVALKPSILPRADAVSDNPSTDEPVVTLHTHSARKHHKHPTRQVSVTELAPFSAPVTLPHVKPVTKIHATPAAAKAATPAQPFMKDYEEPKKDATEMPLGRVILDLVVKLAVVLGVAYGSIYILRAIMGRQGAVVTRKGHLKVLETASLGPNRSVHLVRAGGKVLVIGATGDSINTIGEIDDPNVLAQLQEDGGKPFSLHLDAAVTGDGKAPSVNPAQDGARHLWERVQEIRGLRGTKGGSR